MATYIFFDIRQNSLCKSIEYFKRYSALKEGKKLDYYLEGWQIKMGKDSTLFLCQQLEQ